MCPPTMTLLIGPRKFVRLTWRVVLRLRPSWSFAERAAASEFSVRPSISISRSARRAGRLMETPNNTYRDGSSRAFRDRFEPPDPHVGGGLLAGCGSTRCG